jgi:hypothetical protein
MEEGVKMPISESQSSFEQDTVIDHSIIDGGDFLEKSRL